MHTRGFLAALLIAGLSALASPVTAPTQNAALPNGDLAFTILSDTHGSNFGPYMNGMINQLRMTWSIGVPEAAKRGEKGRVIIDFNVARDGKVGDVRVVAGSSVPDLDKAAQDAVAKSDPFAKLPADFSGDQITLRVTFYYNLKP